MPLQVTVVKSVPMEQKEVPAESAPAARPPANSNVGRFGDLHDYRSTAQAAPTLLTQLHSLPYLSCRSPVAITTERITQDSTKPTQAAMICGSTLCNYR